MESKNDTNNDIMTYTKKIPNQYARSGIFCTKEITCLKSYFTISFFVFSPTYIT